MKRVISAIIAASIMLTLSVNALAVDMPDDGVGRHNIGLSTEPPANPYIVPYAISAPEIWEVWNIVEDCQYDFEGEAASWSDHDLYTNYHFTGKTSYVVFIENYGDSDVTCTFRGWFTDYRVETVPANSTRAYTISTSHCDAEVTEDTIWYIRFSHPCYVRGYVS